MESFRIKNNKKTSQQLVEFLLVVPFVVIIIGVMLEYAYALYVRITVDQGLKQVTTKLYREIDQDFNDEKINTLINNELKNYLADNNVFVAYSDGTEPLSTSYVVVDDTAVFIATYKYLSAVTLPIIYFHFLPEEMNFTLISAVPKTFVSDNTAYISGIDSRTLDKVWGVLDFSQEAGFSASKNGVGSAIDSSTTGTDKMVFLAKITDFPINPVYSIIPWNGEPSKNGTRNESSNPFKPENYTIYNCVNPQDGYVYGCTEKSCIQNSPAGRIDSTYTSIIFVYNDDLSSVSELDSLNSSKWNSSILPYALYMTDSTGKSVGNYDNIKVQKYNKDASVGDAIGDNKYEVTLINKRIYVHRKEDSMEEIKRIAN